MQSNQQFIQPSVNSLSYLNDNYFTSHHYKPQQLFHPQSMPRILSKNYNNFAVEQKPTNPPMPIKSCHKYEDQPLSEQNNAAPIYPEQQSDKNQGMTHNGCLLALL